MVPRLMHLTGLNFAFLYSLFFCMLTRDPGAYMIMTILCISQAQGFSAASITFY